MAIIPGFRRAVQYVRSALFWDFTQPRLVASYGRFGTTYRSHLQPRRSNRILLIWLTTRFCTIYFNFRYKFGIDIAFLIYKRQLIFLKQ